MDEQDLSAQLAQAREQIHSLQQRVDSLELRTAHLPNTQLLDDSFIKRAFAVLGHYIVASLIITIPFYLLIFLIALAIGAW
jgi:hypothetical protein